MTMGRDNPRTSDFKKGARVRVVNSCTAPGLDGQIGTVDQPHAKYPFRVAVEFYDRDFRTVYFHPSELEFVEE